MSNVEFFTNSNFKVLSYLYKNKDANNQVKTTQEEIGQALNMNRTTINYIMVTTNMTHPVEICKSGIYVDVGNSTVDNLRLIEKVLEFYDNKLNSDLVKDISFTLSKV